MEASARARVGWRGCGTVGHPLRPLHCFEWREAVVGERAERQQVAGKRERDCKREWEGKGERD